MWKSLNGLMLLFINILYYLIWKHEYYCCSKMILLRINWSSKMTRRPNCSDQNQVNHIWNDLWTMLNVFWIPLVLYILWQEMRKNIDVILKQNLYLNDDILLIQDDFSFIKTGISTVVFYVKNSKAVRLPKKNTIAQSIPKSIL